VLTGVPSDTAILVDPGVRGAGIDVGDLVTALRGLGAGRTALVPGLARHPELLGAAVRGTGLRTAVVVVTETGSPPLSELRTWGEAGGLDPLGVQVVALDILTAGRTVTERPAYAVRMVSAAVAALGTSGVAPAARRPVGASLSRRALLSGRATTWAPVVRVDAAACVGTVRCERCIEACPERALHLQADSPGAPPVLDVSRCQACSGCLDACPSGALSLYGHEPGALAQQLRALLQAGDGAPAPALVISCANAAEPLHRLGERDGLPGWLALELPCLAAVGSVWHLAALAAGAGTVQILPCAPCRDRVSLMQGVGFTRHLLAALGDLDASRRVGVLPARGPQLLRALRASDGQTPVVSGAAADRIPGPGSIRTPAQVAAWAVSELQAALGTAPAGRTAGLAPSCDREALPRVVLGAGAPLGVLRAASGCTACGACARTCPTGALSLTEEVGITSLVLDPAACTGCCLCVETCPEGVLDAAPGIDLDLLDGGLAPIARVTAVTCPDCGDGIPALPASANLRPLPAELAGRCPRCRQAALLAQG
jgi:ferredoxin